MAAPYEMCTDEYKKYLDDNPSMRVENDRALRMSSWQQKFKTKRERWEAKRKRMQTKLTDHYSPVKQHSLYEAPKYSWEKTGRELVTYNSSADLSYEEASKLTDYLDQRERLGNIWKK